MRVEPWGKGIYERAKVEVRSKVRPASSFGVWLKERRQPCMVIWGSYEV